MLRSFATGCLLLILGVALIYRGLYASDSLLLLGGAAAHFMEHMQLLWADMTQGPKIYVAAGSMLALAGVMMVLIRRRPV